MDELPDSAEAHSRAVIALAMKAERKIAEKLHALRDALEAGQDEEALRIARDITKAKPPRPQRPAQRGGKGKGEKGAA